jgi:hypothetical protein
MASLLKLRQAARLIGVSPGRLCRAIANGRLMAAPSAVPVSQRRSRGRANVLLKKACASLMRLIYQNVLNVSNVPNAPWTRLRRSKPWRDSISHR